MDINGLNRSSAAAPVTAPAAPVEQQTRDRDVIQAVKALNGAELFGENNELQFLKDPLSHRMVVRMIDRKTKEVVAQIPQEYVLELAAQTKPQKV